MLAKSEGDVHGLRAGAWVSLVSWLLCAPWEGAVLLWKKSAMLSETFRGGNNLKFFFEWNSFLWPCCSPRCRSRAVCQLHREMLWPRSCCPSAEFKGLVQLGLGSRHGSAWAWGWIQAQLLLPGLCLAGCWCWGPSLTDGCRCECLQPLVPLPFQPQSVRAARLQGSAECGFGCFWCFAGTHGGSFPSVLAPGAHSPCALGTRWFGSVLFCCASTKAQPAAWAANKNKCTEAYFSFQGIFCSWWRCYFSSWLVCWLLNTLHFVKQGCFSFLAFVVPSAAFFSSLHIPPHLLKKVELILAKCSKFIKIFTTVFIWKDSAVYCNNK